MALKTAQLVYDAAQERLKGTIGAEPMFDMKAYSGGSRGHRGHSKKNAARYRYQETDWLSSHCSTTVADEVTDAHGRTIYYKRRGGTLPAGHYRCKVTNKPNLGGEVIFLDMQPDTRVIHSPFSPRPIPIPRKRVRENDFYIHGKGPKGSDGCIVPEPESERKRLNHVVKNFDGNVILLVINVGYELPAELDGQYA